MYFIPRNIYDEAIDNLVNSVLQKNIVIKLGSFTFFRTILFNLQYLIKLLSLLLKRSAVQG